MSSLALVLGVCAILVFWMLGAYNRLVRLRTAMTQRLQLLVEQWQTQTQAITTRLEQHPIQTIAESQWAQLDDSTLNWRPLTLAARQFLACLRVLQDQPQALAKGDDLSAVWAARRIFESHWQRLQAAQDDLAGAPMPLDLQMLWSHHEPRVKDRLMEYGAAVSDYQQAIRQFPASLVARNFGFRMANNPL